MKFLTVAAVLSVCVITLLAGPAPRGPDGGVALGEHFAPPPILGVTVELDRPPELGTSGLLRARCVGQLPEPLTVTLTFMPPPGFKSLSPPVLTARPVSAGKPCDAEFRFRVEAPCPEGRLQVEASAPCPLPVVKAHFLSRMPLYSARARLEFEDYVANPARTVRARAAVTVRVSAEEARIGQTAPLALHLFPRSLPFAVQPLSCDAMPVCTQDWPQLLKALRSGRLADPEGWCQLHAMALALLLEGRPRTAAGVLGSLLARLSQAPRFGANRQVLAGNLAVALATSGKAAEAMAVWQSLPEQDPYAHFNRATLMETNLEEAVREPALAAYRTALDLAPGYTLARQRMRALDK